MSLRKKQIANQSEWLDVWRNIESHVNRDRIESLIEETVSDISTVCANRRVAFGWSGGKDSLALQYCMEQAGFPDCVMVISNLEYPRFLQWVTDNMPLGLSVVNSGQNLEWLARNLDMLFPQDAQTAAKWFKIIQHTGQERYYRKNQLDLIALGRRRIDGNYTGRSGQNIYTNSKGITRYAPLRDWSHEDVLGLIHYKNLSMPPIYDWPNGFRVGTGSWPARQWTGSIKNGWREIAQIDVSIVIEASKWIESAREFLKEL